MRLAGVFTAFVIIGSNGIRPARAIDPGEAWLGASFAKVRSEGALALRRGDYAEAVRLSTQGAKEAAQAQDFISQGRFLSNLGSAYIMLGESRRAIECLVAGRDTAEKAGDLLTLQAIEANLSTVYVSTGDYEAAAAAAGRGFNIRRAHQDWERQARTLMNFGRAMAKARGLEAAIPIWREALAAAEAAGSLSVEAHVLDMWGYELAEQDDLHQTEAEDVLARAWYKRKLINDARLPLTEGKLARLYRKSGRIIEARRWVDRLVGALERGQRVPLPEWILRAEDAHIASAEGRLQASMVRYRRAQDLVEEWRDKLPPMERTRLGAERKMAQELFEGYLRTAARLYRQKPAPALAAEMFALIQNTRAWSIDTSAARNRGESAGLYAEARRLEAKWLAGEESAKPALEALRTSILEREASASTGEKVSPAGKLEGPGEGETVLTYWLHADGSWLWVWTRHGLVMTPLPPRDTILAAAEAFRSAIEKDDPGGAKLGLQLRRLLLGGMEQECLRAKRWDIVADEGLFRIPFAALPGRDAMYLVEEMELRLIPNARKQPARNGTHHRFFAVADPIFNTADERRAAVWPWQLAAHAGTGLPRLPGTRREADAARAVWSKAGYETAVFTGAESGEEPVLARLTAWQPDIIHFATHTLEAQGRPRLALTLRGDGGQGLLTAEDIAALPLRAELVVMSACHSTGSERAKGSGLLGLTRAWLTAGARQVVSTLWPVGDESTAFFRAFYERLASEKNSALPAVAALRQAQLACIRGGGVAAQPRHWAGHVLLARR